MKNLWSRAICLVLALLLCLSCTGTALAAQEKITIVGANMTLGNDLKMNFMIKKADMKEGFVAKVSQAGGEPVALELWDYNSAYFAASFSVAAKEMTDVLSVEIYDADGQLVSNPFTRTIRQYAMTLLNNASQPDSLKSVIVDMLNYGTEAQKYFSYHEDDYANAQVTEAQQAQYATAQVEVTNKQVAGENFVGANLSLEDSILLNVFFKGITGGDVSGMSAKVCFTNYLGRAVSAEAAVRAQSATMARVTVNQIVLADAKCPVTVTVCDGDTVVGSGVESVESYIARNIDNASTGAINMAIMKFSRSAFLYLGGADPEPEDPHNWNTGELTLPVTETADGQALYTCLDCGETKTEAIPAGTTVYTRADLEKAIEELSWDYLLKKDKIQYDSMELDAMGKYFSGKYLVTEGAAPEHGTSHTEINSVCSDYVWKVYEEALHHNLLGVRSSLEAVTADMWYNAENQVYTSDEEDIDSVLVRWQSLAFTEPEIQYGVPDSPHFVQTKEEVFDYFLNWETKLRSGDVLVDKGHALIFGGYGKVLHCNGTKYQPSSGVLNHEDSGSVYGVSPLNCEDTSWLNTRANTGRLLVFRPTEFLVTKDTDGDLGNDMVRDPDFVMPEDTLSRLSYPGMEIDRTVDITPYGTASVGQELTYSVKISNMSSNTKYMAARQVADPTYAGVKYENLIVTETVPEGTELVSVTEGGVYDEKTNTITWNLTINAGQSVTPAYTVKVTGEMGDTIENGGGFVAKIPSNVICNRIGGAKMNEFAVQTLQELAASDVSTWNFGTDLAFAEAVYEAAETALELPTVARIVEDLFYWTSTLGEIRNTRYAAGKADVDVFMLRENADMSMVIPGYYGGYRFFTGSDAIGSTISEFRLAYLEPGDIIVNCHTAEGSVTAAQIMVYAGNDKLLVCNTDGTYEVLTGSKAKQELWYSFLASNDLFFALRPSQVSDLKAAHTWDEGTVIKAATCAEEGEMIYTCLDDGCGKTKTKILPKTTDHTWAETAADNGNGTHTISCTVCGESRSEAHKWDDGTGDSTEKLFTCTLCDATKTEVGSLSEAQIRLLQSFTYLKGNMSAAANIRQAPPHYADTVYAAICMDGLAEKFASYTAAGALGQAFKVLTNGGYGNFDRDYVLRTEANGYLTENGTAYQVASMVVDGFYGGPWLLDENGNRLTNRGADMEISDLQPGDVLLLGENSAQFEAVMWTLVYQGVIDGNHRFLFGSSYYGGTYTNVAANSIGYRGYLDFDAETLLLTDAVFNASLAGAGDVVEMTMENGIGQCSFNEFLMNDPVSAMQWEYFYAIRPCKVMGHGTHTWDDGVTDESGTTYTCTVCGTTRKEVVVTHTWDAGTVTKAATCGEAGVLTYTCLDCGETKTEVIAATGEHSFGAAEDFGTGHSYTCTVCGESKSEDHTWNLDGTACTACGAAAQTQDYVLTDEQIEMLQGFTYHKGAMTAAANSRQRPVHFADTIYAAMGLDGLVEKFNGGLTAAAALNQGFMRIGNGTGYGSTDRDYVLRTAENGYLEVSGTTFHVASMVVDGFYGGSWIVDADGSRLTDAAAAMDIRDLQPGDVLLLGENTGSYDALLWVLVYQGVLDGQHSFIFGNTYYGGNYTNVSATASYRGKLCFDAATGVLEQAVFNSGISSTGTVVEVPMEARIGTATFHDFLKEDVVSGVAWEYFFAIRPAAVLGN